MANGVKDLKVWQESVALAGDVVRAVKQSTRRETKIFTDQLMSVAVAVGANIAHGYATYGADEQRIAYQEARRSLLELETRLAIAKHAGLIQSATMAQLVGRLTTVGRLLSGYVAYIDRQLADTGRPISSLTTGAIASLDASRVPLADDRPAAGVDR
jgi:four helix bundle protein